eukprot:SAG31_NODE_1723_length_7441_cov_12.555026_5_plen_113_part_00
MEIGECKASFFVEFQSRTSNSRVVLIRSTSASGWYPLAPPRYRACSFIGKDVYKYFESSGIIHGVITEANSLPDSRKFHWTVTYDDGVTQLFDLEDMTNFVVRRKHGTIVRS